MKKLKVTIIGFALFVIGTTCTAKDDSFEWSLFLPAIISGNSKQVLSCSGHKATSCRWEAGGGEVEREFLPDCTVKFYEFGQNYHTDKWKPITGTKISYKGNYSRSYEGEVTSASSFKEKMDGSSNWATYNCLNSISCAGHKVTGCRWEAGGGEVEREFLPDCTVKFYEFGQNYHTDKWKPITGTKISYKGNYSRSYEGVWVSNNRFKEKQTGYDTWYYYSCYHAP